MESLYLLAALKTEEDQEVLQAVMKSNPGIKQLYFGERVRFVKIGGRPGEPVILDGIHEDLFPHFKSLNLNYLHFTNSEYNAVEQFVPLFTGAHTLIVKCSDGDDNCYNDKTGITFDFLAKTITVYIQAYELDGDYLDWLEVTELPSSIRTLKLIDCLSRYGSTSGICNMLRECLNINLSLTEIRKDSTRGDDEEEEEEEEEEDDKKEITRNAKKHPYSVYFHGKRVKL